MSPSERPIELVRTLGDQCVRVLGRVVELSVVLCASYELHHGRLTPAEWGAAVTGAGVLAGYRAKQLNGRG